MSNFIERKCLGNKEKILAKTHEHWIHLVYGLNWLLCLGLIGYAISFSARYYLGSYEGAPYSEFYFIPFGPEHWWAFRLGLIGGFFLFSLEFIGYVTTEIALTGHRIIIKKGLIFVDVKEVDIGEIRTEEVDHLALGRLFNYGTILLDARFVGDVKMVAVRSPHLFLRTAHKARDRLTDQIERS